MNNKNTLPTLSIPKTVITNGAQARGGTGLYNSTKGSKNPLANLFKPINIPSGTPKIIPITESHPVSGQSPYAASKIAADQLALSYEKSFNLPVTVLRPFNTFGPRQSARAIIPTIITQILRSNTLKLGSLFPTRDLTYVEDTVAGFINSINNKKNIGEIINIGSGFEISIKKLSEIISKLMNKKIIIKSHKERIRPKNSEVKRLLASTKKAKKIINWKPKYSGKKGFEHGLKKTIHWFSKKENLKFYKTNIFND